MSGPHFTPGPHSVEYAEHLGDPAYAVRAADGDLIAVGCLKPDADLFASAPALYGALEAIVRAWGNEADESIAHRQAEAALKLARGES